MRAPISSFNHIPPSAYLAATHAGHHSYGLFLQLRYEYHPEQLISIHVGRHPLQSTDPGARCVQSFRCDAAPHPYCCMLNLHAPTAIAFAMGSIAAQVSGISLNGSIFGSCTINDLLLPSDAEWRVPSTQLVVALGMSSPLIIARPHPLLLSRMLNARESAATVLIVVIISKTTHTREPECIPTTATVPLTSGEGLRVSNVDSTHLR